MILAVLEKRAGIAVSNQDVYVSTVGGVRLTEPAADLAIALAVASAVRDRPNPARLVAVGELSLSGEVRAVTQHAQRRGEAERLGYRAVIDTSSRDLSGALGDLARHHRPDPGDEPGF
jgi:DNA repair protein RadA/Sms